MTEPSAMTPDELRDLCDTRFGDRWQRPLARFLGPHSPRGPVEAIDDRLVRRWAAGERAIPQWVADTLQGSTVAKAVIGAPVAYGRMLDALHLVRQHYPRSSIATALILSEAIEAKGGIEKAELCERVVGSRDTASLDTSLCHLEDLGLVSIERQVGYAVTIRLGSFFDAR